MTICLLLLFDALVSDSVSLFSVCFGNASSGTSRIVSFLEGGVIFILNSLDSLLGKSYAGEVGEYFGLGVRSYAGDVGEYFGLGLGS